MKLQLGSLCLAALHQYSFAGIIDLAVLPLVLT
jgi:hypothetical protein